MDIIKHDLGALYASLNHNYREIATPNTAFIAKNDYLMLCNNFDEIKQRALSIIEEREKAYTKRTGQKVQAKTAKAVEIILEVNEDTTAQDIMQSYGEYFKNEFGVEILGLVVHRDEGYLIAKEPPHRRLTSGIEFELDQESGKYYELKSNGKNYERGAELDISAFKEIKNHHAQILISNLRADGSSITAKHEDFKTFDKKFFKDFSNNWQKIYNEKLPHKNPLTHSKPATEQEPKTSVFEPMLDIIADKIIQGTKNKQKLNESLAQYLNDNENPIKRIKSFKHFLGRLNQLAYTDKALNLRDYRTFLSQMRESGANVRLQQIIAQKLSQMSEEELKQNNPKASEQFSKFFGFISNLNAPKELLEPKQEPQQIKEIKTEMARLKAENQELKAENQELKAENQELKDNLENARQEINNILKFFNLPILEKIADFKNSNFLANLKQKIKNAFNRTEVAQISTKSNLNDKQQAKEPKKPERLENDSSTEELFAQLSTNKIKPVKNYKV